MIFAVFDVLLAVNMCINYSFFYIYAYNTAREFPDVEVEKLFELM